MRHIYYKFININNYLNKLYKRYFNYKIILYLKYFYKYIYSSYIVKKIIKKIKYIMFLSLYLIELHVFKYNNFFFTYRCLYNSNYYNTCLKHLLILENKKYYSFIPFIDFILEIIMVFIYIPCLYVAIKDIKKNNIIENMHKYCILVLK
ncbi:hypothetical protein BcabD6B2_58980 (apicoplast) [Babesia caballi]|uniref:Ymf75 n=1 Tax=Babesia caballi TaxID=5871 RepID=A0AAV4M522_BABCB|nr:hypothetical protein BcabD6B2_58980 [Babesia caballi]